MAPILMASLVRTFRQHELVHHTELPASGHSTTRPHRSVITEDANLPVENKYSISPTSAYISFYCSSSIYVRECLRISATNQFAFSMCLILEAPVAFNVHTCMLVCAHKVSKSAHDSKLYYF